MDYACVMFLRYVTDILMNVILLVVLDLSQNYLPVHDLAIPFYLRSVIIGS